jgi:allophanate hydrolase subunit 2
VAAESDRRGLRLAGPCVPGSAADWPTQGVLPGAIPVPPDGQPIVLGWDGPATGGYPVIATVISADWPRLAQARPGDRLRFQTVTVDQARMLVAGDTWTVSEWA